METKSLVNWILLERTSENGQESYEIKKDISKNKNLLATMVFIETLQALKDIEESKKS